MYGLAKILILFLGKANITAKEAVSRWTGKSFACLTPQQIPNQLFSLNMSCDASTKDSEM